MTEVALIDLNHLDRYTAGDRFLRDEILGIFEEQAKSWTALLDPKSDDRTWKDAAHALKGASRGIGAWEVGSLCERAEAYIGDNRNEEKRMEVLAEIRAQVKQTIDEVRVLRDSS
jgi:HPt (histidine-containing phosphotransfer) domain-containing protein